MMRSTTQITAILIALLFAATGCKSEQLSTKETNNNQSSSSGDNQQNTDPNNTNGGNANGGNTNPGNTNPGNDFSPDRDGTAGEDPCRGDSHCYWTGSGGDTGSSFEDGEITGATLDEEGNLTLGNREINREYFIWIANSSQATISKVNTETHEEVARYRTGPGSADPSRTSVNSDGDVFVANRAGQSITKIATANCPTDGEEPHTSTGPNDLKDWGTDDCVLWHTSLSGHGVVRAVAAQDTDEGSFVWAGSWNGVVWKLDGETGEILFQTPSPVAPYGFALDKAGNLWIATLNDPYLGRVDTNKCVDPESCNVTICGDDGEDCAKQRITSPDSGAYGVTVDHKQRVWLGGYGQQVKRYDPYAPAGERWYRLSGLPATYGITASSDGWIYAAAMNGGIARINGDDPTQHTIIPGTSGQSFRGVAIDFHDRLWGINLNHNNAHVFEMGPDLHDTTHIKTLTGLQYPYTYSDMTGTQLRYATQQVGVWRRTFPGCSTNSHEYTEWQTLRFEADVPGTAQLQWRIRAANIAADLPDAEWIDVGSTPPLQSPVDLRPILAQNGLQRARNIEVEVRLQPSVDEEAEVIYVPRVDAVDLIAECPRIHL